MIPLPLLLKFGPYALAGAIAVGGFVWGTVKDAQYQGLKAKVAQERFELAAANNAQLERVRAEAERQRTLAFDEAERQSRRAINAIASLGTVTRKLEELQNVEGETACPVGPATHYVFGVLKDQQHSADNSGGGNPVRGATTNAGLSGPADSPTELE